METPQIYKEYFINMVQDHLWHAIQLGFVQEQIHTSSEQCLEEYCTILHGDNVKVMGEMPVEDTAALLRTLKQTITV